MIRIRRIHSSALPRDRDGIEQARQTLCQHFPRLAAYADGFADMLDQPLRHGHRTAMLVAEADDGKVTGFALVFHLPAVNVCLLDFIAVRGELRGGGTGGALYEAVREYCRQVGANGLYLESLSDEPAVNPSREALEANRRRMRFYESYGVRPIVGTRYEEPLRPTSAPPPVSLLFDGLGRGGPLRRDEARAAVEAILRCKYGRQAAPGYVERVVASFTDEPVRLRPPRYTAAGNGSRQVAAGRLEKTFAAVASTHHAIHHVHERGYVERPARVDALLESIRGTGLFTEVPPRHFGEGPILTVHDRDFVTYLRTVCRTIAGSRPLYPYVFPVRRPERRPKELAVRAGYYCIDTFTPLDANAYEAARASMDVAVTAAEEVLAGRRVAYAICRPPGHHAGRRTFGGFCYFNNAAIAAHRLSREAKVAVLDIDYHHPNGTQDIFYERPDVLTVSIHGHPNEAYPYFSGFADETGQGAGLGFNRNLPLPDGCGERPYAEALDKAAGLIQRHKPAVLVVSFGLDTMKGDPTGSFDLRPHAMRQAGARLAALGLPTLVVQEGGYSLRNLKRGAAAFFGGMAAGLEAGQRT